MCWRIERRTRGLNCQGNVVMLHMPFPMNAHLRPFLVALLLLAGGGTSAVVAWDASDPWQVDEQDQGTGDEDEATLHARTGLSAPVRPAPPRWAQQSRRPVSKPALRLPVGRVPKVRLFERLERRLLPPGSADAQV